MSKAMLVMDMPKSCKDCRIRFSASWSDYCPYEKTGTYYEDVDEFVQHNSKPNWCPLKEVPQRKGLLKQLPKYGTDTHYEQGYNACIDEILEGSEEDG